MSRIGRMPIIIPDNVQVDITNENIIIVSGPNGSLRQWVDGIIKVEKAELDGKKVIVMTRANESKDARSKHGLYRSLVSNMVEGVSKGYSKTLLVSGVGYRCSVTGNKLNMNIGFSHPIVFTIPETIKITCVTPTEIKVEGFDKELVGQVAADIKAFKPVEPYHGYGVRYKDQYVIRKEPKKNIKKK